MMNRDLIRRIQSSSERSTSCKFSLSYNNYLRLSVPACIGFGGRRWSPARRPAGPTLDGDCHRSRVGRVRSMIKRADRLLSNRHLHGQRVKHYQGLCRPLIGARTRPVLLVDWSDLDARKRHYLLRASVAVNGRSATVYEEVHTLASKDKRRTQRFCDSCRHCRSVAGIIVTCGSHALVSAGEALGWDWVGRIPTGTRCVGAVGDAGLTPTAVINRRPAWPTTWVRQS